MAVTATDAIGRTRINGWNVVLLGGAAYGPRLRRAGGALCRRRGEKTSGGNLSHRDHRGSAAGPLALQDFNEELKIL